MHNYNESWRKHIDKHTIDLRGAKKPQPAKNNNAIDVSSKQTEAQVMRYLATMTPEEIEASEVEITEKDLQEYSEALRRSLYSHKQKADTSSNVQLAKADTHTDIQAPNPHESIDRHSLLQELTAELANVEFNAPPTPNEPQPIQQQPTPLQYTPQPIPQQQPTPPQPIQQQPTPQQPVPQPTPLPASSKSHTDALLADIPTKGSKTLDKKLSSFSYRPSVDSGEIVNALAIKTKKSFIKKILVIILVAIIAVVLVGAGFVGGKLVNAQEYAKEYAREGYQYMESGKDALLVFDASAAHHNFQQAYQAFNNIENSFGFFSRSAIDLADLIPFENNISSSAQLLEAGKLYAQAGMQVSLALSQVQDLQNSDEPILNSSTRYNDIQAIIQNFADAQQNFTQANNIVATIHSDNIPAEFRDQFQTLQSQASSIERILQQVQTFLPATLDALGYDYEKRYLFMFQNHSELRATGGFVGTYGTVIVRNGQLEDLFINGIYDPDGQLQARVIPPKPLQYVTPNWGTRDANWFFDFPTSAQKTIRFFEMSGQGSVDGVIAITPHITQQLLQIVGDVEMPEYGVVITADNFLEVVQQEVEVDYDKQLNKPKQILADLAPILIERAMEKDKIEMGRVFFDGLLNKNIMLYSANPDMQTLFEEQGWSGAVQQTSHATHNAINDYLAVVISNIGGGKTDVYTDSVIDSTTTVKHDGSIERTIWFSREHRGGNTPYSWYNKSNYGYVRFYVPLGSQLIEADGFSEEPEYIFTDYIEQGYTTDPDVVRSESTLIKHHESDTDIFEESGKTVFGNWMLIRPGNKQLAYITYRLPATVSSDIQRYNLTMQKQAGVEIQYSDILEVEPDSVVVGDCSLNDERIPISKFSFTQTQDSVFACDITHRQL